MVRADRQAHLGHRVRLQPLGRAGLRRVATCATHGPGGARARGVADGVSVRVVRRVRGRVDAGQRAQPRDLESVDVVQLPEQLVDRGLRRRLVADPDERRVRRSSRGGRFVRDAPRPQHRLGRVLLRDGRLRRARRYELHDDVPLRRGRSRPRAARRTLRELYVGESVSAVTSADAVADFDAHDTAHGQGALIVVVRGEAGDSGSCLDGDPLYSILAMC